MTTYSWHCHFCRSRDVTPLPEMLDPTCSFCNDLLDKVAICDCGRDADDIDGEHCLPCVADMIRSGEQDIECMSEKLAKRVLNHMRKTPDPRVPQLMKRQAGGVG
jgi:hypothetical protein